MSELTVGDFLHDVADRALVVACNRYWLSRHSELTYAMFMRHMRAIERLSEEVTALKTADDLEATAAHIVESINRAAYLTRLEFLGFDSEGRPLPKVGAECGGG